MQISLSSCFSPEFHFEASDKPPRPQKTPGTGRRGRGAPGGAPTAPPGRFPPEGKEVFNAFVEDGRDRWHGPGAESSVLKRYQLRLSRNRKRRGGKTPPRPVFYVNPNQNPPQGLPGLRRVPCRLSSDLCIGALVKRLRLPSCLLRAGPNGCFLLRRRAPANTAAGAVPDSNRFPLRAPGERGMRLYAI